MDVTGNGENLDLPEVYCKDGWTYILKREPFLSTASANDGDTAPFDRDLAAYEEGFEVGKESWIGFDRLVEYEQKSMKIRATITFMHALLSQVNFDRQLRATGGHVGLEGRLRGRQVRTLPDTQAARRSDRNRLQARYCYFLTYPDRTRMSGL